MVVGVPTPEFPFEWDVNNVRRAAKDMNVWYPIALDSDYLGYAQGQNFASRGSAEIGRPARYDPPKILMSGQWAISRDWTVESGASVLNGGDYQLVREGGPIADRTFEIAVCGLAGSSYPPGYGVEGE